MSLWLAAVLRGVGRLIRGPGAGTSAPAEAEAFRDIEAAFPQFRFETLFDVGAHRGDVSALALERFPGARIHAFEPAPAAFEALRERFAASSDVVLNQIALAGRPARLPFVARGDAAANHLVAGSPKYLPEGLIEVEATTGDAYRAGRGVDRVSYLKVSVEGAELKALWGFSKSFAAGAVDFVRVEGSASPDFRLLPSLEELKDLLESHRFRLFRIYGQKPDRRLPTLRRAAMVFVSAALAERAARG